ncbi:tetratricopeptide repeat protein [Streptomyces sp. NPDC005209]|uniref:tetratricopeptide repeat protein n=1 Tax=Streptomyces sp. NPDC005209 TaxID=3156715 RepID=UPI0033ABCB21
MRRADTGCRPTARPLDRCEPRLERALELFTGLGDDLGRANTHRSLGWVSEQRGDLTGALRHNQLALDLFRATGHRPPATGRRGPACSTPSAGTTRCAGSTGRH